MLTKRQWNWPAFRGSADCLKWNRHDLTTLNAALDLVSDRNACIQAGGNLGVFPKRLAEEFTAVYAFEPDAQLFSHMSHNAPEPNIIKLQAALGFDRGGVSTMCSRRDDSGRAVHEGLTHIAGHGIVPTLRIDDLGLAACGLIYLDVEGYELHALRGATETLSRCRPVVGVEINANIEFAGHSADELRRFIIGHGYKLAMALRSDEIFQPC